MRTSCCRKRWLEADLCAKPIVKSDLLSNPPTITPFLATGDVLVLASGSCCCLREARTSLSLIVAMFDCVMQLCKARPRRRTGRNIRKNN
ncbi:hypothetical protein Q1695_009501 [Nippostrongylus brasiliensis]|nr:hypothetical protein Q1695_009501 [Nippostrongylus brasiliensis]